MVILNEAEIRNTVSLTGEVIHQVGEAFQSDNSCFHCQPPVQQMELEPLNGLMCVKSFYTSEKSHFVVKMAGNYRRHQGESSEIHGMMAMYDSSSGQLSAILADNGYLTQIRTAAASGYAIDQLAPKQIDIAVIVGSGTQAKMQLTGLLLVRQPREIRCLGRNTERLARYAAWALDTHGVSISCFTEEVHAVTSADLIITATNSDVPVLHKNTVLACRQFSDLLIIAMGADSKGKRELETSLVLSADRWVCDDINQSFTLGELKEITSEDLDEVFVPVELADIAKAPQPGLTICDLTGVAKLDLAIAEYCLSRSDGNH
ncbi:ethanolamine utilization protein EutC [Veronia pacifica]|uniref:Ethanolamine utilization protein EutC n=1 Tax=Veronia pacifica TaxID=1080227 RepID=A0A1C3EF36_9GAMM|nr:ethanolamine utilization protein EutC [Veronia pacifica]ODA31814.1 ethanolamine utilization protein EutC [Veronia pacifica]